MSSASAFWSNGSFRSRPAAWFRDGGGRTDSGCSPSPFPFWPQDPFTRMLGGRAGPSVTFSWPSYARTWPRRNAAWRARFWWADRGIQDRPDWSPGFAVRSRSDRRMSRSRSWSLPSTLEIHSVVTWISARGIPAWEGFCTVFAGPCGVGRSNRSGLGVDTGARKTKSSWVASIRSPAGDHSGISTSFTPSAPAPHALRKYLPGLRSFGSSISASNSPSLTSAFARATALLFAFP